MTEQPKCIDCEMILMPEIDGFHFRCLECRWKILCEQLDRARKG